MKSRINPSIIITPKLVGYCLSEENRKEVLKIGQKLNTDVAFVGTETAGETVGHVVGINGMERTGNKVVPPECEILIMSGLKSTVIDKVLKLMRESGVDIPLKCTVTPVNQNWEMYRLAEELQKEHEAMNEGR